MQKKNIFIIIGVSVLIALIVWLLIAKNKANAATKAKLQNSNKPQMPRAAMAATSSADSLLTRIGKTIADAIKPPKPTGGAKPGGSGGGAPSGGSGGSGKQPERAPRNSVDSFDAINNTFKDADGNTLQNIESVKTDDFGNTIIKDFDGGVYNVDQNTYTTADGQTYDNVESTRVDENGNTVIDNVDGGTYDPTNGTYYDASGNVYENVEGVHTDEQGNVQIDYPDGSSIDPTTGDYFPPENEAGYGNSTPEQSDPSVDAMGGGNLDYISGDSGGGYDPNQDGYNQSQEYS